MNNDLRHFLARWLGTVAMALVPVVIAAFITMPLSLGRHPGDAVPQGSAVLRHMT
jgi:hypothetical protein